jgi:hypothetical protein
MSDQAITDLLFAHFAGLTFSPAIPIAWPNKPFSEKPSPAPGAMWMRVTILPAEGRVVSLQRTATNIGTLQIDVFAYVDDGEDDAIAVIDQIKQRFAMGTPIEGGGVKVRIVSPPFRGPNVSSVGGRQLGDPSWSMMPVRIRYTVYERAN